MREIRQKMPPGQRAKQFMPFAALKGLEEALARQEKKAAEKKAAGAEAPTERARQRR